MRYVRGVTSKRTRSKKAAPITGVAGGSLGTAANLDETQVLSTADLKAAAPAWLDDDAPERAAPPDVMPPEDLAALGAPSEAPPVATAGAAAVRKAQPEAAPPTVAAPVVPAVVHAAPRVRPQGRSAEQAPSRRVPALAGMAALVILVLVAGAGLLSQLDLGAAGAPTTAPVVVSPTGEPTLATAAPRQEQAGKGKGHCKGKGHGNNCDD